MRVCMRVRESVCGFLNSSKIKTKVFNNNNKFYNLFNTTSEPVIIVDGSL